ncbi:choice-of-anchor J domain-containing protein [Myroides indicus]|uniref:Cleaved adhesin domain-containing protein n=1 Tax=Myroides indicus TaxID=1323422 RepID=A0A4R7EMZ7_9FLAO|nr:choice-of-anchor J domain-containing protein [Myroides indicus]TDS51830.1 cleaved adhesin domain-containing protein [Myroides indicus]
MLALLCLAAAYGIQRWSVTPSFEEFQIHREKQLSTEKTAFSCIPPSDLEVKSVKTDEAVIYWDDSSGSTWEYYVVPYGDPTPSTFTTTTNKEELITQDQNGNSLQPDTQYEFYVRTDCGADGMSSWAGPFDFKTLCSSLTVPFAEGFNTTSTTFDCWTIVDGNQDATSPTDDNIWYGVDVYYAYEGNKAMFFKGDPNKTHDDWLISPAIALTGGIYAISYYYKTSALVADENEFEVLLSQNGIDIDQFTTVLLSKQVYGQSTYKKKTVYVQGITADIHLAWHITSTRQTEVYLDLVTVEEVGCVGIDLDDIAITDLKTDEVTLEWTDDNNTQWEYYVRPVPISGGGVPTGSGTPTNNKEEIITRVNGGGSLLPDTEYEFWVRTDCGSGNKSQWIGPIIFRTPCVVLPLPFTEGFNSDSVTFDCWRIINNNDPSRGWRKYNLYDYRYEGDFGMMLDMRILGLYKYWLISPTFTLDNTKTYKLEYYLQYSRGVVLGTYINDKSFFDENVLIKVGESEYKDLFPNDIDSENPNFIKQTVYLKNIGGDIQVAWGVITDSVEGKRIAIDYVTLEEVVCAGPIKLYKKEEKEDQATIYWEDEINTEWEYVVQKTGKTGIPVGSGVKTTTTENIITKEFNGDSLEPDTVYEYYVRAKCINGQDNANSWSEWEGPMLFRTTCTKMSLPFWEGFNYDSPTASCWRVVYSERGEGSSTWGYSTYSPFEGNRFVELVASNYNTSQSDDWLISSTFTLDATKKYRLKYHFNTNNNTLDIEVLASNKGTVRSDFSNILMAKTYQGLNWEKEEIIISDLGGEVNFAWRVLAPSAGASYFRLDDVYFEELDCLSPEDLNVEDLKEDEVTISWEEDTNLEWEYIVQKEGKGRPVSSGTSTTTNENIISTDIDGNNLDPNTAYEFYVRVNCGGGMYSEWVGPYVFKTGAACKDGFDTPFWEGFNSDSQTVGCWLTVDSGVREALHEGNGIEMGWNNNGLMSMIPESKEGGNIACYYQVDFMGTEQYEAWLISPTIKLDGGKYVLKYDYVALNDLFGFAVDSQFEVLLSEKGTDIDEFSKVLLPKDSYTNTDWKEQLIEIDGIKGDINLAWHITSVGTTLVGLDNISVEKIKDCPKPYGVEIVDETSVSIDIAWQQDGGSSEWEVIVVDYGEDEIAKPVQTVKVTGVPEASLSGLDPNKEYTIYIRSVCAEKDIKSEWSLPIHKIPPQTNVDCNHAKIVPINPGSDWDKYVYGSFVGATASSIDLPSCNGWDTSQQKDIWFEFTATEKVHVLKILDLSIGVTINRMFGALYSQNCGLINSNSPVDCFEITTFDNEDFQILRGLTPGQKYYIRFVESSTNNSVLSFNLSITSPSIEFSPSGDLYSIDELVQEVFIRSESDCEVTSNIDYIISKSLVLPDGTMIIGNPNTIGYFKNTKGKEVFPFEEGVILSNADVDINTFGAYELDLVNHPPFPRDYVIDPDLENLYGNMSTTGLSHQAILEFDFIPLTDSLQWEYLFASDCFGDVCVFSNDLNGGGVVGSWIINKETEERTNVALTPQTEQPVGAMYIMDKELRCFDINPDLVGWINNINDMRYDKRKSPINFTGMTVPLQTKKAEVVPGHKYRIKIVAGSRCVRGHHSAVFLNGGSFNVGDITLGSDLLIETNNALCDNQTSVIRLYTDVSDVIKKEYEWYKDGVLISSANTPDLEVSEAGEYKVVMYLTELNCEFTDTIVVEAYPAISETVHQAESIVVCSTSLQDIRVNLTQVEAGMFRNVDTEIYIIAGYYNTMEDAEAAKNAIADAANYSLGKEVQPQNLYIRVENTVTSCYEVFVLPIQPEEGAVPDKPSDITVCAEYVFPATAGNQYYYTEPGGAGKAYKTGDILAEPGEHTIYLLQVNSEEGCYEETAYQVNITAPVTADVFEDKTLSCEYYQLVPLSEHNHYYTEPERQGNELYAGMQILQGQTIYVYASSEDGLCTDESSFTIDYEDCPIPRGISPNNDGLNDVFDLTPHGVESIKIYNRWGTEVYSHNEGYTTQWYGQNKNGKQLPDGTYYYVIQAHGKIRTGWVQINK